MGFWIFENFWNFSKKKWKSGNWKYFEKFEFKLEFTKNSWNSEMKFWKKNLKSWNFQKKSFFGITFFQNFFSFWTFLIFYDFIVFFLIPLFSEFSDFLKFPPFTTPLLLFFPVVNHYFFIFFAFINCYHCYQFEHFLFSLNVRILDFREIDETQRKEKGASVSPETRQQCRPLGASETDTYALDHNIHF